MSRGVPLPPRGSVADKIMVELLRRERENEVAKWEMSMMLDAAFSGVRKDDYMPGIASMRRQLEQRLDHRAYSAAHVVEYLEHKRTEVQRERDMLARLEALDKLGDA